MTTHPNLTNLHLLAKATRSAQIATGMNIGTSVKAGMFRVELVTYANRKTIVDPLSDDLDMAGAIAVLDQIAADKGWKKQ